MNTSEAAASSLRLNTELFSLNPSSLIMLFEIDIKDLLFDAGYDTSNTRYIYRFHNNQKFFPSNIIYGKETYQAAPINAEGFEMGGKGVLATPRLSITTSSEGIPYITSLKQEIYKLGDLVGAKVTRIRTFAKFLDASNFSPVPPGLIPDPYAYLDKDVFYIDRKEHEDDRSIQYSLTSILDLENIQIPARVVFQNRCFFSYRGEGCCYEYRLNDDKGKALQKEMFGKDAILPLAAPPVATFTDERIEKIVGTQIKNAGEYNASKLLEYRKGDAVYFSKHMINYYFVCRQDKPLSGPPNSNYWVADVCSKSVFGCKLRYGREGKAEGAAYPKGYLPYGGFASVNRYS